MKLTNKYNLPETFVNIMKRPTYSTGGAHLSVTQLIDSPKVVALKKKHDDDLEEDVADRVWSIFGSAVHAVLEHGKDDKHIVEERIHAEVDGWFISGAVDLQVMNDDGTISIRDYKTTSVWAVMKDKTEWEQQLNMYAYLVETVKQKPVKDLGIVAIIRDWSRRDASVKLGYPEAPVKELHIKLWPHDIRQKYVLDRIAKHSQCDFAMETGEPMPVCTPEEMWEKQAVYAVTKIGGVRAKSLHDTEAEANAALEKIGKGYEVIVREGERTRCANFCPVRNHCSQWKEYLEGREVFSEQIKEQS